jgi:hypothetical protein
MAFGDPYATIDELEARLGKEDDGSFTRLLVAASRAVESFTRRQFNRDDEYDIVSARRFRALDRERVAVDDFWTLEGLMVEVNGRVWDVDRHIDARPWDGITHGQVGWPYSDLFAVGRRFPWSRRALITVAAQWGWEFVPAGIVEATLDVAEAMYLARSATASGTVRSELIGGCSISYAVPQHRLSAEEIPPELVKALPYRRKVYGVA